MAIQARTLRIATLRSWIASSDDGFAAARFRQSRNRAARFRPDVVVLLAAEPDGGDTLRCLRGDPELAGVPVVGVGAAGPGRVGAAGEHAVQRLVDVAGGAKGGDELRVEVGHGAFLRLA